MKTLSIFREPWVLVRIAIVALVGMEPGILIADLYSELFGAFPGCLTLGAALGAVFGASLQWFVETSRRWEGPRAVKNGRET